MAIRCLKCMKEHEEGITKCPFCGYIEGAEEDEQCYLPPRTVLKGRYMIGYCLGSGGFGVTYVAWDSLLEKKVAIKEYLPSELATRTMGETRVTVHDNDCIEKYQQGKRSFLEESRRLAKFNSVKGIVSIFDCFDENDTAYIVMECLEGKTLQQILKERKKLPFKEALPIFVDVLEALDIVHEAGMMHRDIAPDNIFVCSDGTAKLIDFGAARFMTTTHSRSLSMILKIGYAPIEQYTKHGNQGAWTDVYAVAATLYHALTGIVPPDSYDRVEEDKLKKPSLMARGLPKHAETAMLNALNIIETNRTQSAKQFADELKGDIDVARIREKIKHEDTGRIAKWMKYAAAGFALAIVAFAVLFVVSGGSLFRPDDYDVPDGMSRVPYVINANVSDADNTLNSSSLHMVISDRVTDEFFDNNYVLLQNPRSGNIAYKGSAVNVTASMKPDEYFIPDLTDCTKEYAVGVLEAAGFDVTIKDGTSTTTALGAVISQDPVGNTIVYEGSEVTLVINSAESFINTNNYIVVPDYVGRQFKEAKSNALEKNVYMSISSGEYSDNIPAGQILSQSPSSGNSIADGDTIYVTVSLGKRTIIVPNLLYMNEEAALEKIEDRLLVANVKYVEDTSVEEGLVLAQIPASGKSIYENGEVTIYVSSGYKVNVPNVVGKTQDEAQNELSSLRLGYAITTENSDTIPKGTVMEQSIEEGSSVSIGTIVTLTVSAGSEVIEVTGVKLNASNLTLEYGEVYTMVATITPKNATTTSVKWSSSNNSVVSVNSAGVITAKGVGTATITVKTKDGGHTATCTVTVIKVIKELVLVKPKQLGYFLNEKENRDGLVLTAVYSDGSREVVTDSSNTVISGFDASSSGDKTIVLQYSYGGTTLSTSYKVHIRALDRINIKKPTTTTYEIGDSLSLEGFKVTAVYDDSVTKDVTTAADVTGFSSDRGCICTVTVTYTEGRTRSATFDCTILGDMAIASNNSENSLFVGESMTLTVSYKNDANADLTTIKWRSTNTNVLTVSGSGEKCTVTAVGIGEANIIAQDIYGATATVKATGKLTQITIEPTDIGILDNKQTITLTATTDNPNADLSKIKWESTDPGVISVSGNGKSCTVIAENVGSVRVIAEYASTEDLKSTDERTVKAYGAWTPDYVEVSAKDEAKYEYASRSEYSTRTRSVTKETHTDTSSSLSGWTQSGSYVTWGNVWESTTYYNETETLDYIGSHTVDEGSNQTKTRQVEKTREVFDHYEYTYGRLVKTSDPGGTGTWCKNSPSYGDTWVYANVGTGRQYDKDKAWGTTRIDPYGTRSCGCCGTVNSYKIWPDGVNKGNYDTFWYEYIRTVNRSETYYETETYTEWVSKWVTYYQYKSGTKYYNYYRWPNWPNWTDNWSSWKAGTAPSAGVTESGDTKTETEVKTRTTYIWREKP